MPTKGRPIVRPERFEGATLALWKAKESILATPRSEWTVDDRNALMALSMYFDEASSFRGNRIVLDRCSDPYVKLLTAQLSRSAA